MNNLGQFSGSVAAAGSVRLPTKTFKSILFKSIAGLTVRGYSCNGNVQDWVLPYDGLAINLGHSLCFL